MYQYNSKGEKVRNQVFPKNVRENYGSDKKTDSKKKKKIAFWAVLSVAVVAILVIIWLWMKNKHGGSSPSPSPRSVKSPNPNMGFKPKKWGFSFY
jgi:flagellar basal body-associated protein FliL